MAHKYGHSCSLYKKSDNCTINNNDNSMTIAFYEICVFMSLECKIANPLLALSCPNGIGLLSKASNFKRSYAIVK